MLTIPIAGFSQLISSIAFGSCGHQNKDQPVLTTAAKMNPDIFIFVGDNIYGDTRRTKVLTSKYQKLGTKPEFQELKDSSLILATWDDHDYGKNDGGREYPKKEQSKELFLEFWEEPENSERRNYKGIYTSYFFEEEGKIVQIILLDTRTFRTKLLRAKGKEFRNDYRPNYDSKATMLGKEQWLWLEKQLKEPVDVRIIASSTQFAIEYNGYEAWANFPLEQKKMLDLINKTNAQGVIFISGDVHYAELSMIEAEEGFKVIDLTSSGITQTWGHVEENKNRIGEAFRDNNFGLVEIDWTQIRPEISLSIFDVKGEIKIQYTIESN